MLQVVIHQRHSKAADVYSFGIVLWELMTWQVPWNEYNEFQVVSSQTTCDSLFLVQQMLLTGHHFWLHAFVRAS